MLGKTAGNDEKVRILIQYEKQLIDSNLRVPINVLRNGEKTLRDALSETSKPYGKYAIDLRMDFGQVWP